MAIGAILGGLGLVTSLIGSEKAASSAKSSGIAQSNAILQRGFTERKYKRRELKKLLSTQEVAYSKSGVTLEGSPLLVISDSYNKGTEELRDMERESQRQANIARETGQAQAMGYRMNFISNALTTAGNYYIMSSGENNG
jgi:hypothetical protein